MKIFHFSTKPNVSTQLNFQVSVYLYFNYERQCKMCDTQILLSANDHFAVLLTGCQIHNAVFNLTENTKNPYSKAASHYVSRPPWNKVQKAVYHFRNRHEINVKYATGIVLIPGMDPSLIQRRGQGSEEELLCYGPRSATQMIQSQHGHILPPQPLCIKPGPE